MEYTLLSCIDSRIENPRKFYGRFEVGPFVPGQGLTVANALRRSLLSELTGTAITLVEINEASHEYETLIGVRESVLDILLNLKQIILTRSFDLSTSQVGFLTIKGPGVVRARDLKLPDSIYSVDPDQYIATLSTNGCLNLKFIIASGKNYITNTPNTIKNQNWITLLKQNSPECFLVEKPKELKQSDQIQKELQQSNQLQPKSAIDLSEQWENEKSLVSINTTTKTQTDFFKAKTSNINSENEKLINQQFNTLNKKRGYFPIDAIFMPVKSVNYLIESNNNLEFAQDRIILEVWTNGSIHPRQAIHQAAKSLIELFLPLQQKQLNSFQNKSKLANNLPLQETLSKKMGLTKTENFTRIDLQKIIYLTKLKQNPHLWSTELAKITEYKHEILLLKQEAANPRKNQSQIDKIEIKIQLIATKIKKLKSQIETMNQLQQTSLGYQFDLRILDLDIGNLDLPLQSYSSLKQVNINTIRDLIFFSQEKFSELPYLNQRSFKQIETLLANLDFGFLINAIKISCNPKF